MCTGTVGLDFFCGHEIFVVFVSESMRENKICAILFHTIHVAIDSS